MEYFWSPNDDQLIGLAEMYHEEPRFKANFDRMHPEMSMFMREAVKIYVENRKKKG
jgi:MerR family transcriptional regulator, thiopeptide resistance regulator